MTVGNKKKTMRLGHKCDETHPVLSDLIKHLLSLTPGNITKDVNYLKWGVIGGNYFLDSAILFIYLNVWVHSVKRNSTSPLNLRKYGKFATGRIRLTVVWHQSSRSHSTAQHISLLVFMNKFSTKPQKNKQSRGESESKQQQPQKTCETS